MISSMRMWTESEKVMPPKAESHGGWVLSQAVAQQVGVDFVAGTASLSKSRQPTHELLERDQPSTYDVVHSFREEEP
jgi:hypothetical protein